MRELLSCFWPSISGPNAVECSALAHTDALLSFSLWLRTEEIYPGRTRTQLLLPASKFILRRSLARSPSRLMRKSSRIFDDGAHFHWCWMPRAYPAQVNRPFRGNQRFFLFARRFSPRINQLGAEEAFLRRGLLLGCFLRNWGLRKVFDFARFGEKRSNIGDERRASSIFFRVSYFLFRTIPSLKGGNTSAYRLHHIIFLQNSL